jgi:universal stress protein A
MYKNILFASDLTEQSTMIGQKAKHLADKFGADVHMIHIVEPIGAYAGGWYYLDDLNEEIKSQAQESFDKIATQLSLNSDHCHLTTGHTKHEILEYAKKLKVDLIVLGTHGAKGFGVLLGSTASSVLNAAECDVLTIPINTLKAD